jgi:hypothetical protein
MASPPKRYLGDGVYVETDMIGRVKLTTEDGISVTNTIYLEEYVINALCRYWDDVIKATN